MFCKRFSILLLLKEVQDQTSTPNFLVPETPLQVHSTTSAFNLATSPTANVRVQADTSMLPSTPQAPFCMAFKHTTEKLLHLPASIPATKNTSICSFGCCDCLHHVVFHSLTHRALCRCLSEIWPLPHSAKPSQPEITFKQTKPFSDSCVRYSHTNASS